MDKLFAFISIAGFAVQRTLELLDPLAAGVILLWKKRGDGKLPWELTDSAAKAWLMSLFAFLISIPIACVAPGNILAEIGITKNWPSVFIVALAIGAGSNGLNSVLKFGQLVKDARKAEVQPPAEVKVQPATATIRQGTTIDILASVSGADGTAVTWEVLEGANGGTVVPVSASPATGRYTAPAVAGNYRVAAIIRADPPAMAIATIQVQ